MPQRELYRATLRAAVVIAGGEVALSVHLKVPVETLKFWLDNNVPVPVTAYLGAVDVITSDKIPDQRQQ